MKQLARSASVTCAMENALQEGHCVRNRWQVIKKIGQGAFGEVYHCQDRKDGNQVAIKIFSKEKDATAANQLLKLEVSVLKALQGENYFPKFFAFGKTMRFDYLAMELLGPSLSELRRKQPDRRFSLSTSLRLGEMMLKCIQALHRTGFVHRDIKPSNFVMGLGMNARKVFLLDFGLSRQILLENGDLRPARPKASFQGTPRYASINVLNHKEAGRHDDLISLFYVLSEFAFQEMPWKNLRELRDVALAKQMYDHQVMVKEFPDGFQDYFYHVKDLTYCDEPNYELLYSVFDQCIKRRGVKETDPFDFEIGDLVPFVELQKKGGSLSAQSQKSQSDVLIVKCSSIDKPENMEDQLNNVKPLNGLIENFSESNLAEECCKNTDKLDINSKDLDNSCKELEPPDNGEQMQILASINPNQESAIPNEPKTTPSIPLLAEPINLYPLEVCTSNQNECMVVDSILPDNVTFEQEKINQADDFQLQDKNVCENVKNPISLAVPLEKLYLEVNKPIKEIDMHPIRRSVSQPARILSFVINDLKEPDISKKQTIPRWRSCPTISFFSQSDLKPPSKQQSSFEANVYKLQDIATTKKGDSVRIDCKRNSLPIILTCPKIHDRVSETKENSKIDISLRRHSENKASICNRKASINNVPKTSQSLNLNFTLVSDSETVAKKSLSDSNIGLRKSTKYFQKKINKDGINPSKICTQYRLERTPNHQDICKQGKEINPVSISKLNPPNYSLRKSAPCILENMLSLVNQIDCQGKNVITNGFSIGYSNMKNESNASNITDNSSPKNEYAPPQISGSGESNINSDSRINSSFSNVNYSLHSSIKEPTNLDTPIALTNMAFSGNDNSETSHKLSNSLSENNLQSTKNVTPRKESSTEDTSSLNFKNCNKMDNHFQNGVCKQGKETNPDSISKLNPPNYSLRKSAPSIFENISSHIYPSQGNGVSLNRSLNSLKNNPPQILIPQIKLTVCEDNISCSESIDKNSRSLSTNILPSLANEDRENLLTSEAVLLNSKICNDTDNSLQSNEFITLHASEFEKNSINQPKLNEDTSHKVNDSSSLLQKDCIDLNVPDIVVNTTVNENSKELKNEISENMSVNEMQCTENETHKKVLPSENTILVDSEPCNGTETFQNNETISQKMSESSNKSGYSDYSDGGLYPNENYPLHSLTDKHSESIVQDTVKNPTECESSVSEPTNKLNKSMSESTMQSTDNMTTLSRRRQRENSDDKYVKSETELNLNFTRRRQRPTSQIYETPPPVFESNSQELDFPSALLYHKRQDSQNVSGELLDPPPDEPPPNHCLPSRRVRYRRA